MGYIQGGGGDVIRLFFFLTVVHDNLQCFLRPVESSYVNSGHTDLTRLTEPGPMIKLEIQK